MKLKMHGILQSGKVGSSLACEGQGVLAGPKSAPRKAHEKQWNVCHLLISNKFSVSTIPK